VRHTGVFTFRTPVAREIYRSLSPEIGEIASRSEATVTLDGEGCLVLTVNAMDIPSLRAALNMWLRLISVAGEMLAITGEGTGSEGGMGASEPGR